MEKKDYIKYINKMLEEIQDLRMIRAIYTFVQMIYLRK